MKVVAATAEVIPLWAALQKAWETNPGLIASFALYLQTPGNGQFIIFSANDRITGWEERIIRKENDFAVKGNGRPTQ